MSAFWRRCLPVLALALAGCESLYVPVEKKGANRPAAAPKVRLQGPERPFRVARVHTGDLIELEDGRRVRYLGVLAPGPGERWFQESREANRQLVEGRRVLLRWEEEAQTDAGELLAYVLVSRDQYPQPPEKADEQYLIANRAMIGSGSARASTQPERYYYRGWFLDTEIQARERKLGIWQD